MIYLYDADGFYCGTFIYEKGKALPKNQGTELMPPVGTQNQVACFLGGEWQLINKPETETLIAIVIDNVTNSLPDFDDSDNQYTLRENTDCLATGSLDIPDQNFRVPVVRTDTNRKVYMLASVKDGAFTLTLNFKTGGEWLVNSDLINSELATPLFSIAEYKFKVV